MDSQREKTRNRIAFALAVAGTAGLGIFLDYFHREIRDFCMAHAPVSPALALCSCSAVPHVQSLGLRYLLCLCTHRSSVLNVASSEALACLGSLLDQETLRLDCNAGAQPSEAALLSMCSLVHLAATEHCKADILSEKWLARVGHLVDRTEDYGIHTAAAAVLQTSIQCSAGSEPTLDSLRCIAESRATYRLLHCGFLRLRSEERDQVDSEQHGLPSNRSCLIEACQHLKPVGRGRSALLHRLRLGPDANLQMLATTTLLCSLSSDEHIRDSLLRSGLLLELDALVSKWNPQRLGSQNYPCVSRLLYLVSLLVSNASVARYIVEHHQWTDHIQQLLRLDDSDIQLFTVILLAALMEAHPGGVSLLQSVGLGAIYRVVDRMDVDVRNAVRHVLDLMAKHPALAENRVTQQEGPMRPFALDEEFNNVAR